MIPGTVKQPAVDVEVLASRAVAVERQGTAQQHPADHETGEGENRRDAQGR
jgi:hypothetical protein